ncbi:MULTISPECIES: cyclase dehydrase [Methylobacterium]|jgi:hypothetical protein|uniref:Cyclase dehydrase n=1 Tax=Methylobacterium hispanicum TaxID=270350 RepID=A0AAV4ZT51_9HYPH|nr:MULTISPECIES: cyclase dehydrase [Methylobacterium]GJD91291.1 hypothetical protein BHAOGJBA_4839 [Methylobacterium hispanicum]
MSVPSRRRSRFASDPRRRPAPAAAQFARGLGWFSLGLGVTELAFGDAIARWLGMPRSGPLIRAYGLREIAQGAGILGAQDPTPWICARVAGDGIDIASVLPALEGDNPNRGNAMVALASLAGVTVADVLCAQALIDAPRMPSDAVRAEYGRRSGFPRAAAAMRGAAADFEPPADIVGPEAMRAWTAPAA